MAFKPDQAFILAAGRGARLRPYTDSVPKPLVPLGGQPIIDGVLERLEAAGIRDVTVNLHYMADILAAHLGKRVSPRLHFSREESLLETGGGIKKGLKLMRPEPFFVVSGDSLWTDGASAPAISRMASAWDAQKMDILILLQPVTHMVLTPGAGDYDLQPDGRAIRRADKTGAYMWTSVRICRPEIFRGMPDTPFSFLTLLDEAERKGRLYGLIHDGEWYHITTPDDVERVNQALSTQKIYA